MSIDTEFTVFAILRSLSSVEKEANKLLRTVIEAVKGDFSNDTFNELFGQVSPLRSKTILLHKSHPPENVSKEAFLLNTSVNRINKILRHTEKQLALWKPIENSIAFEETRTVAMLIQDVYNLSNMSNQFSTKQEMLNVLMRVDRAVDAMTSLHGPLDANSDLLLGSIVKHKLCRSILTDLDTKKAPATWTNIREALAECIESLEAIESKRQPKQRPTCYACRKYHILLFCPVFRAMSVADRWKLVQRVNICAVCFSAHHIAENCDKTFRCCTKRASHNSLLHLTGNSSDE